MTGKLSIFNCPPNRLSQPNTLPSLSFVSQATRETAVAATRETAVAATRDSQNALHML